MNKYKILFVDDETIYLRYLQKVLDWEALGFEVCGCLTDGVQVVEQAESLKPDIILMDIKMSRMDGIEAARILSERGIPSHIIIMTAHDEFSFAQQALRIGVFDYLLKPFDAGELQQVLKKCVVQIEQERRQIRERLQAGLQSLLMEEEQQNLHVLSEIEGNAVCVALLVLETHVTGERREYLCSKIADSMQTKGIQSYFAGMQNGALAAVFVHEDTLPEGKLKHRFLRFMNTEPDHGIRFVSIGSEEDKKERLLLSYRHACVVLENRFKLTDGTVHDYHDLDQLSTEVTMLTPQDVKNLILGLELGDYEESDRILEKVFHLSDGNMFSFQYVIGIYHTLRMEIYGYYGVNPELPFQIIQQEAEAFINAVAAAHTKEEMMQIVRKKIVQIFEESRKQPAKRKHEMLALRIEQYLQQHYTDCGLTIQEIAQELYFENSYLRRIYKEQTGKRITQRLEEIRIEAAQKMLLAGTCKAGEIAERTGFSDQQYFSRRFKMVCGCTPSQYKSRCQAGKDRKTGNGIQD